MDEKVLKRSRLPLRGKKHHVLRARKTYAFLAALRTRVQGFGYGEIPETINPFGDDGRWYVNGNWFAICPFKYEPDGNGGTYPAGYGTDCAFIRAESTDPNVVDIYKEEYVEMPANEGLVKTPFLQMVFSRNGKARVTLEILRPDGSGEVLYRQSFTVIIDNPEWSDVRQVGVVL